MTHVCTIVVFCVSRLLGMTIRWSRVDYCGSGRYEGGPRLEGQPDLSINCESTTIDKPPQNGQVLQNLSGLDDNRATTHCTDPLTLYPFYHSSQLSLLRSLALCHLIRCFFTTDPTYLALVIKLCILLSRYQSAHPECCATPIISSGASKSQLRRHPRSVHVSVNAFQQSVNLTEPDLATEFRDVAFESHTSGHRDYPSLLERRVNALEAGFSPTHNPPGLNHAIEHYEVALNLKQLHPDQHDLHTSLASALQTRHWQSIRLVGLGFALNHYNSAQALFPTSHVKHRASLYHLASSLFSRYKHLDELSDLESAIGIYRSLLDVDVGYPERDTLLYALANGLLIRFQRLGELEDLDLSIQYHNAALKLRAPGHHNRPRSLVACASARRNHFRVTGDVSVLDGAIGLDKAVLDLYSPRHPERYAALVGLANSLVARFQQSNNLDDLGVAIEHYEAALGLCPPGPIERSILLLYLAEALRVAYEKRGRVEDLETAFALLYAALDNSAKHHPVLLHIHGSLATCYFVQYDITQYVPHLQSAFAHRRAASACRSGGPSQQFQAAMQWVASAEIHNHSSALDAYRSALHALDRYVTTGCSVLTRHQIIKKAPGLAANAASCAVRQSQVTVAVELLEQGRALSWTHLARFRSSVDELRNGGNHERKLADNFERLSSQVRQTPDPPEVAHALHYWQLSKDWDELVEKIRQVEGFTRFLMPPLMDDLLEAARDGPVIIMNVALYSCDAIIVLQSGTPRHIPLRHLTLGDVGQLSTSFSEILKSTASSEGTARQRRLVAFLRQVWQLVVSPVVDALMGMEDTVPKGSRIWWCPTSKFTSLPLHAAGPYRRGEPNLSDLYISSYTPTLSALIRRRGRDTEASPVMKKFVAIGQPNPRGSRNRELHSVNIEMDVVRRLLPPSVSFTELHEDAATKEGALRALRQHSWVHLACHGKQDLGQPFNSCFAMRDGPVSLLDIIQLDLKETAFAFLSACHSAVGDEATPDEAIHLAAGMQFSGFRSVIGTMWSVDDESVHHMVSAVYKNLVEEGMDYRNAAKALNQAVKTVDRHKVTLEQRIVFIHIGA